MNNLELFEVLKSIEKLYCEPSNQVVVKAWEVINFEELKKVHAQKFKTNAQVFSEDYVIFHVDNVHDIIWIIFF